MAKRYEIVQRLAVLREEGYLIFGSGNVVHNLQKADWDNGTQSTHRFHDYIRSANVCFSINIRNLDIFFIVF